MRATWLASLCSVWVASHALAEREPCSLAGAPHVLLRVDPPLPAALDEQTTAELAAALRAAQVGVCSSEPGSGQTLASIAIVPVAQRDALNIRVHDAVTGKTLEREVNLQALPADSRATALALYVEELLEASWAEITLSNRQQLQQPAPAEVARIVERAERAPAPAGERRLRVSLGGLWAAWSGGLSWLGPELTLGFQALSWLEPALHVAYCSSPQVRAPHGTIDVQSVLVGLSLDPGWPLGGPFSLQLPQGVSVANVVFLAHATAGAAGSGSGKHAALIAEHGLGLRVQWWSSLSLRVLGHFVWAIVPARASDDGRAVTGISGVGAAAEVAIDGHF